MKIDENTTLNQILAKNKLIPNSAFYTFAGAVILTVVGGWINIHMSFAKIETEIEILKVRFDKDEKLITENTKKFEEIQNTLYEIKIELVQKKDIKRE